MDKQNEIVEEILAKLKGLKYAEVLSIFADCKIKIMDRLSVVQ
ncbi:MAG: hypothetical protein R2771_14135 [Saprospiraceae bacterium]